VADRKKRSTRSAAAKPEAKHSAEELRGIVRNVVQSVLGSAAEVPDDVQLMDIGLDSLGVTELATRLSASLGIRVPPTMVFSYPTLKDITAFTLGLFDLSEQSDKVKPAQDARASTTPDSAAIAVTGMSCRFPGDINSTSALWDVLCAGEDKISEVSLNRWDTDSIVAMMEDVDNDVIDRIRYGGFLSDEVIGAFDASFFRISQAEASRMDPAQRLLLTVSYEALVDAGYTRDSVKGKKVGVFVGASGNMGEVESVKSSLSSAHKPSVYDATGSTLSVAAGRISYVLELEGPSMTIDTACSSSLVALHSARRSLQLGECDIAIVASEGMLSAASSIACAVAGMTSSDGKCHSFDEDAKGYGRGEGAGAVVLKRLADASASDDSVYAVVRGSAVAQDGKSASLTAPNGLAQEQLLRSALLDAGLDAQDVSFIEAHGTGTKLGDPVETAAMGAVYGSSDGDVPVFVSSVKANIGHLEAAAGMAGLMTAILALQHEQSPPNAQLRKLNEQVQLSVGEGRLVFPTSVTPLRRVSDKPLTAGLSSFGYSGTIAHVLLQEPDGAVCRRRELPQVPVSPSARYAAVSGMVWQFSGQGTLSCNACRDLFNQEPEFKRAFDACDRIVQMELGQSIAALLYPDGTETEQKPTALNDSIVAQPIIVALQYSLSQLWLARGIAPEAVLGHSLGEYAAAVAAQVMTLENCLRLVCARARIMHGHVGGLGTMCAVRLTEQEANAAIASTGSEQLVSVAAVNGPRSIVISGSDAAVARVLEAAGCTTSSRKLNVSHAFHSPLMRGMLEEYRQVLETVQLHPPAVQMISTVGHTTAAVNSVQYWLDHIVQPVHYLQALQNAMRMDGSLFVEFGADATLSRLSKTIGFDFDRNQRERQYVSAAEMD
jgi:acyl transferase domain-containing protein/acyl carrier protein